MRLRVLWAAVGVLLSACGSSVPSAQAPSTPATQAPVVPSAQAPSAPATQAPGLPATQAPSAAPAATAPPAPTSPAPAAAPSPTSADSLHGQPLLPDPTGAAQPTPTHPPVGQSVPARLAIDAIQLDRPLVSVGLDRQNVPIVPDHDVGWYNLSAGPGQGENIVLWGHVLRFRKSPGTPAPFEHLKDLPLGAQILLYDSQGTPYRYVVTKQVRVTPDQVEYILPQGKERLTLVSCIGDKVIANSGVVEMSHRLVTIAEPAS